MAPSGTGRWSPNPKGRQPLDPEHRVAVVCAPGDARVLHRDRAQLPPGSERRRRSARLGVASCEIVEDAADHPPGRTGLRRSRPVPGVRAGLARNLGPLPAELNAPGVRDDSPDCGVQDRREVVGRPVGAVAQERAPVVLADGERLLAKGVAHGVRPPPQVLQRPVLTRIAEAHRSRPGAGDGRGGLVSGHGTRTDFLRFWTTGSAFVLILPWVAVQVIGRWRRFGQESCRGPDRFRVVPQHCPPRAPGGVHAL